MSANVNTRGIYVETDGGDFEELPSWASYLVSVGTAFAKSRSASDRSVVALVLPTRNFAATLVATGITLHRAAEPVGSNDLQTHFDHLCSLPANTKVIYTSGKVQYKGLLVGVEQDSGVRGLRLKIAKQNETVIVVFLQKSGGIELSEWEGQLSERISARRIARRPGFLDAVLGPDQFRQFVTKSRLDTVLIGNARLINDEISNYRIAAEASSDSLYEGTFRDLLRIRRLDPNRAFRSDLLSDTSGSLPAGANPLETAIIFDGSTGFMRMRSKTSAFSQIVILDRTSSRFVDGVSAVNEEYSRESRNDCAAIYREHMNIAWGIEVMAFREQRK
jgi:hypothetical protein